MPWIKKTLKYLLTKATGVPKYLEPFVDDLTKKLTKLNRDISSVKSAIAKKQTIKNLPTNVNTAEEYLKMLIKQRDEISSQLGSLYLRGYYKLPVRGAAALGAYKAAETVGSIFSGDSTDEKKSQQPTNKPQEENPATIPINSKIPGQPQTDNAIGIPPDQPPKPPTKTTAVGLPPEKTDTSTETDKPYTSTTQQGSVTVDKPSDKNKLGRTSYFLLGSSPVMLYYFYKYKKELDSCNRDKECEEYVKEKYKSFLVPSLIGAASSGVLTSIFGKKLGDYISRVSQEE